MSTQKMIRNDEPFLYLLLFFFTSDLCSGRLANKCNPSVSLKSKRRINNVNYQFNVEIFQHAFCFYNLLVSLRNFNVCHFLVTFVCYLRVIKIPWTQTVLEEKIRFVNIYN